MTLREYMQENYPDRIREDAWGGVRGCPRLYDSTTKKFGDYCIITNQDPSSEACKKCWDREIEAPVEIKENVEHPSHYNAHNIEVIDFIQDWELNFCLGNVIKYVCRSPYKGTQIEDLKKAREYLDFEIKRLEGGK